MSDGPDEVEISFHASERLVAWLDAEADRRMLTREATVQQLLAETHENRTEGAPAGDDGSGHDGGGEALPTDTDADTTPEGDGTTDEDLAALADEVKGQRTKADALDRNPSVWEVQRRDGRKFYVVEHPDGGTRTHDNREAAAVDVASHYE